MIPKMTEKELMIGNLVSYKDATYSVSEIHKMNGRYYCVLDDNSHIYVDKLNPIKLTKDILLKCGFTNNYHTNTKFIYTYSDSISGLCVDVCKNTNEILSIHYYGHGTDVKYVHELQNFITVNKL